MPEPVTPEPGAPGMNGIPGEGGSPMGPETVVQKIWRFVRGLIGLDSGQTAPGGGGEMPPVEAPTEGVPGGKPAPVPVPGPKG
jgi:hypothetical protein